MQLPHSRHVHEEGACGCQEVTGQIPGLEAGINETTEGPEDGFGSVAASFASFPLLLRLHCHASILLLLSHANNRRHYVSLLLLTIQQKTRNHKKPGNCLSITTVTFTLSSLTHYAASKAASGSKVRGRQCSNAY